LAKDGWKARKVPPLAQVKEKTTMMMMKAAKRELHSAATPNPLVYKTPVAMTSAKSASWKTERNQTWMKVVMNVSSASMITISCQIPDVNVRHPFASPMNLAWETCALYASRLTLQWTMDAHLSSPSAMVQEWANLVRPVSSVKIPLRKDRMMDVRLGMVFVLPLGLMQAETLAMNVPFASMMSLMMIKVVLILDARTQNLESVLVTTGKEARAVPLVSMKCKIHPSQILGALTQQIHLAMLFLENLV
jgi:hypothetical protein